MPTVPLLTQPALWLALLSAVLFAGLDLSQKWSARYAIATPAGFLALRLLGSALLSPLLLLLPGALTGKHLEWGPFIGFVAANLLGNALYLVSLYRADVSVIGSLWPLKSAVLPIILWIVPPHQQFPLLDYLVIAVSVVGAILIAWNGKLRFRAFRDKAVLLMVCVTVPVFAVSDLFFAQSASALGSPLTTCLANVALAVLVVPPLLLHSPTRKVIADGLRDKRNENGSRDRRGLLGALLTCAFLVAGVAAIGQAFGLAYQGGDARGVVWVNILAMTSGVVLLGVNAARPGWLESEKRSVYGVRFAGALLLIVAVTRLLFVKTG